MRQVYPKSNKLVDQISSPETFTSPDNQAFSPYSPAVVVLRRPMDMGVLVPVLDGHLPAGYLVKVSLVAAAGALSLLVQVPTVWVAHSSGAHLDS